MMLLYLVNSPERNLRLSPIQVLQYKLGQALAENTPLQGCSHDVGLYAHKGTMCNTDDRVQMSKSQYEGGALTPPPPPPPVLPQGHPPAMFSEGFSRPTEETPLVSWQVIVLRVDVTPAGDSSEQESPCDLQNLRRPMDINNSLDNLVYNAIQRGPCWPTGRGTTRAVVSRA